jgi:hypothetical protein
MGELQIFEDSEMWGDVDEPEHCWPLDSSARKKC